MKASLSVVLLLLAGTAYAAPSSSQATRAAAAAMPPRVPGVSDAGNAIIAKAQMTPDPQLNALASERRQLFSQLVTLAAAPHADVDKVAAVMKRNGQIQAEMRERSDVHLIGAMRQLSEADRTVFLRALVPQSPGAPR